LLRYAYEKNNLVSSLLRHLNQKSVGDFILKMIQIDPDATIELEMLRVTHNFEDRLAASSCLTI
jgi:hypothetical protein